MPKHSFTLGENRTIFVTLDELNALRAKAGASPVVAPVTQRVANAIGSNSSNQAQIKAQQNQFARTNAQFNQTQDYFNQNPSVLADVNAQIAAQNRGLTGTEEQMRQATGTFGTPTDSGGTQFVTGQRNDVKDVLSQASEGAKQAKLRASQNIVDLTNKFALDKSIGDQLIQDWTNTMGTAKLGGTAEAVRQPDGTMKVVAPYDPQGNFRELAAQRLREAGKTENEIKAFLESPEYTKAISETMSNTGLGGTFDQKGNFVPPTVLTNQQKIEKAGQDAIKQFADYGKQGLSIDPYAVEQTKQAAMATEAQKIASEAQQNVAKAQSITAGKPTEVTPQSTTPQNNAPTPQIGNLNLPNLPNVDPRIAGAFQPVIDQLAQNQKTYEDQLRKDLNAIDNPVDSNGDPLPKLSDQIAGLTNELKLARQDQLDRAERSKQYVLDQAAEIKRSQEKELAYTKAQFDLKQSLQINQQIEANADNELRNRRIANSMGIAHDTGGLEWMQKEVRKGNELLTYLQTSTNLQDAQFNENARSISENYRLNVVKATLDYDATNAEISSTFSKGIKDLASMLTLDAKEKAKEKSTLLRDYMKSKNEADTKMAEMIKDVNVKSIESLDRARNESKKDLMSTKDTLGFTSNLRSGIQSNKVISQANEASSFHGVVEAGYARYTQILNDIKSGKLSPKDGEVALGPSQTAVISSLSRMLDPQSVVRDAEYERQVKGVAWVNMVTGLYDKITKGGTALTATDIAEMKKVADEVNQVWQKRLSDNLQPFILDIDAWNSAYPESAIKYEQVLTNIDKINLPSQKANSLIDSFKNAPSGKSGFRTDRHNNPTAFTTDIAKQAGLKEGVDYVNGDPFPNGKGVTAKLLGDPIDTSIKVIDNIGFYTKSGAQRWSHTAIPKSQWDNMDYNEKRNVIAKMYKNEGGSGILAKQSSKTYSFSDKKDDQIIIQ